MKALDAIFIFFCLCGVVFGVIGAVYLDGGYWALNSAIWATVCLVDGVFDALS